MSGKRSFSGHLVDSLKLITRDQDKMTHKRRFFDSHGVHNSRGKKHDGMPMTLMRWLKNKFHRNPSARFGRSQPTCRPARTTGRKIPRGKRRGYGADKAAAQTKRQGMAALGHAEQRRRRIEAFRANAQHNRKRAMQSGITHYVWVWPGVPDCDIGRRNNGKVFSYANPPPEGHPCEGECHAKDWCRCITKSVIPT